MTPEQIAEIECEPTCNLKRHLALIGFCNCDRGKLKAALKEARSDQPAVDISLQKMLEAANDEIAELLTAYDQQAAELDAKDRELKLWQSIADNWAKDREELRAKLDESKLLLEHTSHDYHTGMSGSEFRQRRDDLLKEQADE